MAERAWFSGGGTELVFSSLHRAAREPEEVSRNECTQPAAEEVFPGAPRWAWLQPAQDQRQNGPAQDSTEEKTAHIHRSSSSDTTQGSSEL